MLNLKYAYGENSENVPLIQVVRFLDQIILGSTLLPFHSMNNQLHTLENSGYALR